MTYPVWINGSAEGRIDPADRGLAYGDGLFETMRYCQGRVALQEAHLSRLSQSAQALAIPVDTAALREQLGQFQQCCPPEAVIKIVLTRGCSGRGYLADPKASPTCIFSAHPLPHYAAVAMQVGVATLTLARQPHLAGHKHLNRLEQVLLRQEQAKQAVDELVVLDSAGFVIEGVSSNIFWARANALYTPALSQAGVKGVMRQALLQYAQQQGIEVQEGFYTLSDLLQAEEIFFCNSVMGVRPVKNICEAQKITDYRVGQLTQKMLSFWQSL